MPKLTDDQVRIEALEIEVRDLRARLDESTRPTPVPVEPPKPRAVVEEGARVYTMAPSNPDFTMPTDSELDQLLSIVLNALPVLRPPRFDRFNNDLGLGDLGTEFKTAFWALGILVRRADKPDLGRATSWWLDHVNEQLRIAGRSSITSAAPLIAAVLAHGVKHTIGAARFPHDVAIGLAAYGGGKPAGNEWRQVISSGRVRAPDELPPQYRAVRPQTSVRAG